MQQGSSMEDNAWPLLHNSFVTACRQARSGQQGGAPTAAADIGLSNTASVSAMQGEEEARVWSHIVEMHSEPDRHYHTLQHLHAMMEWLNTAYAQQQDQLHSAWSNPISPAGRAPPHVVLAVLFHDCIYNPHATDNEQQSAQVAKRHLQALHCSSQLITLVEQYILATTSHAVPPGVQDTDLELFLDADLSILAAEPASYDQYSASIQLEYSHLSDAAFSRGRHAVLVRLLQKSHLFYSQYAQKLGLQQRAAENIARELHGIKCDSLQLSCPD